MYSEGAGDMSAAKKQHVMSILIVDDDAPFRARLARAFRERGYDVRAFANGKDALANVNEHGSTQLALVDLRMPGEWGLHVVKALVQIDQKVRVVVLTAYGSIATALEAVRLGAVSYLQKPATVEEIVHEFSRPGDSLDRASSELASESSESTARAYGPPPPSRVPSLARAEWEHINRVLTDCDGNISKAAKLLGLHRRTLQRKLAKFPQPAWKD